jgi:hypothetical protein
LKPDLIDLENKTKELYKWDDHRLSDDEVEYAFLAAPFKTRILIVYGSAIKFKSKLNFDFIAVIGGISGI